MVSEVSVPLVPFSGCMEREDDVVRNTFKAELLTFSWPESREEREGAQFQNYLKDHDSSDFTYSNCPHHLLIPSFSSNAINLRKALNIFAFQTIKIQTTKITLYIYDCSKIFLKI